MTESINLKEEIKKLITIQAIDSEIFELSSTKETFPGRLAEMDELLETKKSGMQEAEGTLKSLQVEKNSKETDLKAGEEKIIKFEGELSQIKTNKEYSAMLEQIESAKADISLLEEKIIGLLDEVDKAQVKCDEEKKLFSEESVVIQKEKDVIKAEEKEIDSKINELKTKRDEAVKNVDQKVLAQYEQILKNRGKNALAKVNGECCGGCNMVLRPQVINEAKLLKSIVRCDNCSRILYSDDI